jgi:hypothetical protein
MTTVVSHQSTAKRLSLRGANEKSDVAISFSYGIASSVASLTPRNDVLYDLCFEMKLGLWKGYYTYY